MPTRSLTNRSADDDAIPGEDTSEVSSLETDETDTAHNMSSGHEALCGAIASLEARRRLPRGLCHSYREDEPRTRQGV